MTVCAVLAAGGSGERLRSDRPKAFARLGDLPLLAESLRRLEESDWIDEIVVAVPAGWEEPAVLLAEELGAGKVVACVTGASTRTGSVRAAVEAADPHAALLLVHDAARPLLPEEVLERVLTPFAEGWDGVVPTLPLPDTVKRVRGEEVVETLPRGELVAAQTPQAFLAPALRAALAAGDDGTDCAELVERRGGRIKVVAGDPRLLKVTNPEDLELVASWL
jgi:2-C-methyl-D-erythritol 4-phosphate cytidylyltransferase